MIASPNWVNEINKLEFEITISQLKPILCTLCSWIEVKLFWKFGVIVECKFEATINIV